jgi:epoxide hydrolase-like predicted phosphatase
MHNIPSNSVKALLFDLGGVVIEIDFDRVFSHWALYANQKPETIKSRFEFDSYYERHERGEIEALEYFAWLRRSLGINISNEEFIAGWNSIYIGEIPGIEAILSDVKEKLPIYVFTNSNSTHQLVWSKKYSHILNHFRYVFVSCEIGKRKPEPEAFKIVSKEIGVKPQHILFFDDTLEHIAGAEKIGMQAVHVESSRDIEILLKEILA